MDMHKMKIGVEMTGNQPKDTVMPNPNSFLTLASTYVLFSCASGDILR